MNSKSFFEKFHNEQETHRFESYVAIENVFVYLRTKKSIQSIFIKKLKNEFLIDRKLKKALSLSFVTWKCELNFFFVCNNWKKCNIHSIF